MFVEAIRVDNSRVTSKFREKLGLYFDACSIARKTWVFKNSWLIDEPDKTFAATANNLGDTGG